MDGQPYNNPVYAKALARKPRVRIERIGNRLICNWELSYPVQLIEQGQRARDLKQGLLAGPAARPVKLRFSKVDGHVLNPWDEAARYTKVPFRHKTRDMNRRIYDELRDTDMLGEEFDHFDRQYKFRGEVDPERLVMNGSPSASPNPWERGSSQAEDPYGYLWRTGKYASIQPVEMGETASGNPIRQYLTFRTVSTPRFDSKGRYIGSDPHSWVSPHRDPRPVYAAVEAHLASTIQQILQ